MTSSTASQLKLATSIGLAMVSVGLALGLTGWGLTGMWIAILAFTPISVALETYLSRRRRSFRSHGDGASGERRDALA